MRRSKFLSLLLAFALVANFAWIPTGIGNNYGISTCDEDPLDFAFNDD